MRVSFFCSILFILKGVSGFSTSHRSLIARPYNNKPTSLLLHYYLSATASADDQASNHHHALDTDALVKYTVAIGTQMSLFYATFSAMDWLLQGRRLIVPLPLNFVLFYAIALKSRIFNPLSNTRPKVKTLEATTTSTTLTEKRIMPSWTPPGVVFPIMWLLIIGPIRAMTSCWIYQSTHCYTHPAIFAFVLHLAIGDTWNTINNVEKRYGTAVVGVLAVWLSKAHAVYRYFQVVPAAGKLLSVTLVWLTIAAALVTATWRLNLDPRTGQPQSLYPVRGTAVRTVFQWFGNKE